MSSNIRPWKGISPRIVGQKESNNGPDELEWTL